MQHAHFLAILIVLILIVLSTTSAGAQVTQDQPEVVVLGEPEVPQDESAPSRTLGESELRRQASGRLEMALADAGVTQFRRSDSRSAHPTSQGPSLRGLGGNASSRVLLLWEGIPQTDPFFGYAAWPGYDALPWIRATLRRGGGTGVDGAGALGGTIHLESEEPGPELAFGGEFLGGSRNTFATRTQGAFPTGPVHSLVGLSMERSDGFIPVPVAQRGSADQPAAYQQAGAALRSEVALSRGVSVRAIGRAFYDERSRGLAHTDNLQRGFDIGLRADSERARRDGWSALVYLQSREFASSFASVNDTREEARQVLDQHNVPSMGLGGRLEYSPHWGRDLDVRLGTDYRRVSGKNEERYLFMEAIPQRGRRAGGINENWGLFSAASWRLSPRVVLSASTRLDVWRMHGGYLQERELGGEVMTDHQYASRSGTENTSRLGTRIELLPGLDLRSAAYTGFRMPTLNELYRPYRVGADATQANPALSPERLWGTELGLSATHPRGARFELTVFENQLRNAVANVTIDQGPGTFDGVGFVSAGGRYSRRENLRALHTRGVEVTAALDLQSLLSVARLRGLVLDATSTLLTAEVRDNRTGTELSGKVPAQVPRHALTTVLSWYPEPGGSGSSVALRYWGEQFEDDRNLILLDDAWTLDWVGSLRLAPGVLVTLRAENLTSTRVLAAKDGAGVVQTTSPRTIWLGLRYETASLGPVAGER